jgi:hypothetical protein
MHAYKAPLRDIRFVIHEVLELGAHYRALGRDDVTPDLVDSVLEEGARFTEEVLAPTNLPGDSEGVHYENGVVRTPAGVRLDKWKQRMGEFDNDRAWRILDAVQAIAKELGATASAVSLAWLLAKPTVTSVIFGARSLAQLDENLAAADVTLTAAHVKALDDASAFDLGYPYKFIENIQKRW